MGLGQFVGLGKGSAIGSDGHQFALERERENVSRNDGRHQRRDENLLDDTGSGDETFVPQHDGGHVADGRECTARIGCDDDQRGIDESVFLALYQFAEYHHHDDTGGEVVENGRQHECHEHDAPQECFLALGLQRVTHKVETSVLVDDFNNGHGTHQEE